MTRGNVLGRCLAQIMLCVVLLGAPLHAFVLTPTTLHARSGVTELGLRSACSSNTYSRKFACASKRPVMMAQKVEGEGVEPAYNVLGMELECCCADVRGGIGTGFFRDGHCSTGPTDEGRHTVCVQVTEEFLTFSKMVGNDLSTPVPQYLFPGLIPGDLWCLCAQRWVQALENGAAPKLFLRATHMKTLQHTDLETLKAYALDLKEAEEEVAALDKLREQLKKSL
mmetsp:Transcript_26666/g.63370  ORF Transcript_26666/g.63370 Transcript_26666/m.63370 type:complete len:225 (+) Transcript_26666:2-676(+)